MSSRILHRRAGIRAAAMAALLVSSIVHPAQAQRGPGGDPFAGLTGSWSGTGSITLANGATERLRCRAAYADAGANSLRLNLRCNSDSYDFDLRSQLAYEGGAISGNWVDTVRNVSGNVSGRAAPGQIQGTVQGPGFAAALSLATRGNRQSVTIRSSGELRQVSVDLTRSGR